MTSTELQLSPNSAVSCPVEALICPGRQQIYSVSSPPPLIPPLPLPPLITNTQQPSTLALTHEELNVIKAQLQGVVLNADDELEPNTEPGLDLDLITATASSAGPAIVSCTMAGEGSGSVCISPAVPSPTTTTSTGGHEVRNVHYFSHLNRINLAEVKRNSEGLFSWSQRNYLSFAARKVRCFPERFRLPGHYLQQSSLLLLTHGWASADRYCQCCIPNKKNPGGECRLHRFCPYCSWRAGQQAALTFVPSFRKGTWHSVTGSYTGDVVIRSLADMHSWTLYWDAYRHAFAVMVQESQVRGVYLTEELAVTSMLPTITLPHVHAIVEADEWTPKHSMRLAELVLANLNQQPVDLVQPVVPNVLAKSIQTEQSLLYRVGYLFKPLDLVPAYRRAWDGLVEAQGDGRPTDNLSLAVRLNSDASDLVLGYSHVNTDRPKMRGLGNLSYRQRKSFLGVNKRDHGQHRERIRQLGQQKPEHSADDAGKCCTEKCIVTA